MQSADKTTIKVVHVYVSTTVLANDIQILRFISFHFWKYLKVIFVIFRKQYLGIPSSKQLFKLEAKSGGSN